jgi:Subtilase family
MANNIASITPAAGRPELVVIAKSHAQLRAGSRQITSAAPGVDTTSLQGLLDQHAAVMRPLFGLSEDRLRAQARAAAPDAADTAGAESRQSGPELSLFYHIAVEPERMGALASQLIAHDLVEGAYIKPPAEPPLAPNTAGTLTVAAPRPEDAPATTPNFVAHQIYRDQTPAGVDALFAATLPGGDGSKVKIIDCEWGWRFTHEDLLKNQGGVVAGTGGADTDHGTAVLGIISGDDNSFGVTGLAPGAVISASSFNDQSSSAAINCRPAISSCSKSIAQVRTRRTRSAGNSVSSPSSGGRTTSRRSSTR